MLESQQPKRTAEQKPVKDIDPDTWNLTALTSKSIKDMQAAVTEAATQVSGFKDAITTDTENETIKQALEAYEELQGLLQELQARVHLPYLADRADTEATAERSATLKFIADTEEAVAFFKESLAALSEQKATSLIAENPHFAGFLQNSRAALPHALTAVQEKSFTERKQAFEDRFDAVFEELSFEVNGTTVGVKQLKKLFNSADRDERAAAYQARVDAVKDKKNELFELYREGVLLWDSERGSTARNFESAVAMRSFENGLSPVAEAALLACCRKNGKLYQDFLSKKQAVLGLAELSRSDVLAPLDSAALSISYKEARETVIDSFKAYSETFGTIAQAIHDQGHVDAEPRAAKRATGSCQWAGPASLPYTVETFLGTLPSAVTKAHEIGHAVHTTLSQAQGSLSWWPGLSVAETASSLGEQIFLEHYSRLHPELREELLFYRVTDAFDAILETAARCQFEIAAHEAIISGATATDVHALYLAGLQELYGAAVVIDEQFAIEWLSFGSLYHVPFHVNAYAFGGLAAHAIFEKSNTEGPAYRRDVEDFLKAGGSVSPHDLFIPLGFDIEFEADWQRGFDRIQKLMSALQ